MHGQPEMTNVCSQGCAGGATPRGGQNHPPRERCDVHTGRRPFLSRF
jgi:hypothetical protein